MSEIPVSMKSLVLRVACGEGRGLRSANSGDLAIESADRVAVCFAAGDHVRVGGSRGEVEGQDLAGEGGKDFVGCLMQVMLATAVW